MLKLSPQWKRHDLWPQWNIAPMEEALSRQWNILPLFIAPIKKTCFYERFFFEMIMVMVKDKEVQ